MHSEFRRLPVERHERAQHARRLGNPRHRDALPFKRAQEPSTNTLPALSTSLGPTKVTTPTNTPSSTTTPSASQAKATSAVSSAVPLSSTPLTSSVSSQTPTVSAASTTPLSTSTQPEVATPLSSPSSTTSQSVVLITGSPTPSTSNSNASASRSSSQLSGGAIGGIIAASVIAALALLIFMVRKTYLRRRQTRRVSWPDGNIFGETKPLPEPPVKGFSEKRGSERSAPASPFVEHGQQRQPTQPPFQRTQSPFAGYASPAPPVQRTQSPFTGYTVPSPPDPSYNNPMSTYSPYPTLNPRNSEATVAMARAAAGADSYSASAPGLKANMEAFVNRAFVPSLPDELSITGGERIRVVALYDDGWALCANGRGEQGMVPQECLDQRMVSDGGDWRSARRSSSLIPDY